MISLSNFLFENNQIYSIYIDMDGVLCDFEERFEHFTGMHPQEYKENAIYQYGEKKGLEKFWDIIDNQVGIRFWRGMGWMPEGRELWDYIKDKTPILLTSPSRHDNSKEGKTLWVKDNLGNYPIEFKRAQDKSNFASPTSILIDDREDTIMSWKQKNGIGFLYKNNTQDIIRELQKLGI
jgi:hypothetical protein